MHIPGCQKNGAFHMGIQKNRAFHILFVEKRGPIIYLAALKKGAIRHAHPYYAIYRKLPPPPPPGTQQAHDVNTTSLKCCIDVEPSLYERHVPAGKSLSKQILFGKKKEKKNLSRPLSIKKLKERNMHLLHKFKLFQKKKNKKKTLLAFKLLGAF